ncbi:MAG: T9SS C-terminal target domain-containing protein [Bacteroidetes bacterium]|nr:MAG: T9SS C-terminal target domain-containing protein [Bacteroidota bacterium]
MDPHGHVYAATGLDIQGAGAGTGIYRSTDNGETWQPINTGLTDTTITDLAVYPNGTLLAATRNGGVHRSTDGGDSWHPINTGLPSLTVTALAVTEEGFVFAGTDQGIYRSTRAIATAAEDETALPDGFALAQNYPNPFNPATTIRYALPEAAEVRLTVYDALGREVKRLVDGLRVAGEHEVVFEGQGLPSGVYMYRLTAGGVTQTRRMVLMK